MPTILAKDLPYEAHETIKGVKKGPPYSYPKDGTEFKNYEKLLPIKESGYYREFTVSAPNMSNNRGAKRIVVGKNEEIYYTDDHYQTFKKVNNE